MRHIQQTLILLLILVGLISCKKYLDLKPDKKLTVPSSVNDLQALLDNTSIMNKKSSTYDIASADDHFIPLSIYSTMSENQRKAYIWENFEYNYLNDWALLYEGIYYSNVVLEELQNIERNSLNALEWDNVKGSALMYRASYFLKAVWTFSKSYDPQESNQDLGIVLRTDSDFDQPVMRSSVMQTYVQIIEDLTQSVPLLPEKPTHVMRPSKWAAYGLLARTYLSMRSYDSAFKYANLCLTIEDDLLDYNSANLTTIYPFRPAPNKEVIMNNQVGTMIYQAGTEVRLDTILYQQYHNNDLRKNLFFRVRPDGYQQFKGTYVGNLSSLFTGLAVDEILITRAECHARLGRTTESMEDINTLLRTRYKTGTYTDYHTSSAEEALTIILAERRKELVFRGLRWMDIKRLNKEGANIILIRNINGITYTLDPNENRYALPLPTDVINISGIAQNPQ